MATFFQDNFTASNGTNVLSHTPDVGTGWSQHPSYPVGDVVISSNNARTNTGGATVLVYSNTAPASADYAVEATVLLNNPTTAGFTFSVCARVDPTADTYYSIQMYDSYPFFQLVRRVAGADTVIGTPISNGWSDGSTHTLGITVAGNIITAQFDGVTGITADDSGSAITAAGRPGLRPSGGMGDFGGGDHYWAADHFIATQSGGSGGGGTHNLLLLGV